MSCTGAACLRVTLRLGVCENGYFLHSEYTFCKMDISSEKSTPTNLPRLSTYLLVITSPFHHAHLHSYTVLIKGECGSAIIIFSLSVALLRPYYRQYPMQPSPAFPQPKASLPDVLCERKTLQNKNQVRDSIPCASLYPRDAVLYIRFSPPFRPTTTSHPPLQPTHTPTPPTRTTAHSDPPAPTPSTSPARRS